MRDITAIVGLLSLSAGCSWAWPPLGLIVFGGVLLAVAVAGAPRDGKPANGRGAPAVHETENPSNPYGV